MKFIQLFAFLALAAGNENFLITEAKEMLLTQGVDLSVIRAGLADFSNTARPKSVSDLITELKKLSNYADLNIDESKLQTLEANIMALFNQANRDFNAELADDTKEYIRGRLTRQMVTPFATMKSAINDFDASTLKQTPTLQLELELDMILGGLKAVYFDFRDKIDLVSSRLDRAARNLDFLTIRRINEELKQLGGLVAKNGG